MRQPSRQEANYPEQGQVSQADLPLLSFEWAATPMIFEIENFSRSETNAYMFCYI